MKSPVRFEKRLTQPSWLNWGVPLLSLLAALVIGAMVLQLTGKDALDVYDRIFERGFASKRALQGSLITATPLAFTGLCAAVAFRMGVINIGGEGQLYVGAIGAALVGIAMDGQPVGFVVVCMVFMGMLFGAAYGSIVGVLRARFNTNEIITSLMLNYIAGILLNYLIFNSRSYWRDPRSQGFPSGKPIGERGEWTKFSFFGVSVPLGFLIAIFAGVAVWLLYKRTRFGFEVGVIADSPRAAAYAGIRTRWTIVAVMALSGALAGLGGASDVGDFRHLLDAKGLQLSNYGYTGIVVAALARLNPLATIFVAVLLGGLTNAGYALQGPDFPSGLVGTLQGLILFSSVAGEVLLRYRIRPNRATSDVAVAS